MLSSISSMIEQFNQNNIKILKKIGCRLTIAANFKKGNTTDSATTSSFYNFLKKNSLNPIHLPIPRSINFFNIIKSFFLIRKLLKKYSFSLVHCYTPIAAMLIRVNSIFLKNKLNIIYTAHGFHFYNGAPILNWLVYFPIEKLLSKYVNILITINKEDFELGKRKFKNINNIFLVNGVGVNRKKFSPTDRKTKMELKKKFNVPSEDFIFLSVAEFNKNKNHKLILQFVKQLSKKIYNSSKKVSKRC